MKSDKEFLSLLEQSKHTVSLVTDWLNSEGYLAKALPMSVRPSVDERWKYTDEGDIEVAFRVEVKHWPDRDFRSVEDVPFSDVIVDEVYKVEKQHKRKLLAYIIVNSSETGILLIPSSTRKFWHKKSVMDGRDRRKVEAYFVPKKFISYKSLEG